MEQMKGSAVLLLELLILGGLRAGKGSAVLGTLDLQIDEEQPAGTIIGDISAGLPPGTSAYMYFISAQEGSGVATDLGIDENTGIIKTARVLDRETRDRYSFIAVTPEGITVEVNIQVNDINDHAPAFPKQHSTFQIPEHTPIGSRFPLDPAFDADSGLLNTQGYVIKGDNVGQAFRLETRRGPNGVLYLDLVVSNVLDRENRSSYSLLLEAYDGGSPPRSTQMMLDISIQDINDNAPTFNQSRYHTLISENLKPGSSILQVFASDADEGENGDVIYEINRRQSDPDQYFTIDSRTGVIKLNKGLDYEVRKVHELVVQARDKAVHPEVTTAFVTIHVRDYNDNQPTMTIIFLSEDGSPQISEGAQPGQYVARISEGKMLWDQQLEGLRYIYCCCCLPSPVFCWNLPRGQWAEVSRTGCGTSCTMAMIGWWQSGQVALWMVHGWMHSMQKECPQGSSHAASARGLKQMVQVSSMGPPQAAPGVDCSWCLWLLQCGDACPPWEAALMTTRYQASPVPGTSLVGCWQSFKDSWSTSSTLTPCTPPGRP